MDQAQPLTNYKTLAMRARAATSKLNTFRNASYSPKSVDVNKYSNLNNSFKTSTPALMDGSLFGKAKIQKYEGSFAKEGQWLKGLGSITVPYGGTTRYAGTDGHFAVDIGNKPHTPIYSFAPGKVIEVNTGADHGRKEGHGYGNYVIIQDKFGAKHRYAHFAGIDNNIKKGTTVGKGQFLGGMGDSGATYGGTTYDKSGEDFVGTHLHYDLEYGKDNFVDPFAYLISNFYNKQQYG